MLRDERDHDRRILAALALVDRHGVRRRELVGVGELVDDVALAVETHGQVLGFEIDGHQHAEVAVVDALPMVVLDLHQPVAHAKRPPGDQPFDLVRCRGIERGLQFLIEPDHAGVAAPHRRQHLDVAQGVQPELARDAL